MAKRTPEENATRRLRDWAKGEHRDSDLARDIRTVLDRGGPMPGYVIVTLYGEIVHAYGDEDGRPFPTRAKAQTVVRQMKRNDEAMYSHDGQPVTHKICKVLGGES